MSQIGRIIYFLNQGKFMTANQPSHRVQDAFLENLDLSNRDHGIILSELAEGGIVGIIARLDPNIAANRAIALMLIGLEFSPEIEAKDYDVFVGKIDPNTLSGSYLLTIINGEDLLSEKAKELIALKIDEGKINFQEFDSEMGSTISNLLEVGVVRLQIGSLNIAAMVDPNLQIGGFN